MPDYKKSKVYKLVNNLNDHFYIGSTVQPLHKRMGEHRSKHNKCMSKNIGVDLKECKIILVEAFECENRQELLQKEREYFDKYKVEGLNLVNRYRPIVTKEEEKEQDKQYKIDNKDKIKEQDKQYRIDNKDKRKQYTKQYNIDNKDKLNEREKQYRIDNKDKIKERKKQYKIDNKEKIKEKYTCECGSTIRKFGKQRHNKSQKHLDYLKTII